MPCEEFVGNSSTPLEWVIGTTEFDLASTRFYKRDRYRTTLRILDLHDYELILLCSIGIINDILSSIKEVGVIPSGFSDWLSLRSRNTLQVMMLWREVLIIAMCKIMPRGVEVHAAKRTIVICTPMTVLHINEE